MSECWRYGDVLKLRGDWLAREDPDGSDNLRDRRAMVVNEKSIIFLAPTSSPRLYPPQPDCWERAERDVVATDESVFVNGPCDGQTKWVAAGARAHRVMELPSIPHPVYDEETLTDPEPVTYITHEYERCACGCGRMIWRRDWT